MATYYFDFDNGSDINDGSTPALALKNLCGTSLATGNAVFNPQAGDNLYLARGSTWNLPLNWAFNPGDEGAVGNPVVIDAYDRTGETGQHKPIVSRFDEPATGDWTLTATPGVWEYDFVQGTTINRLFLDMVGQKSGATSIATCNATTPWWADKAGAKFYIYTGSNVNNPSDLYDVKIPFAAYTLIMQNVSYIEFNNICFRGSGSFPVYIYNNLLGTDTGNITIDNCDTDYCGTGGIGISTNVAQEFSGLITISNCNIDKTWFTNENSTTTTFEGNGVTLVGGGINHNVIIRDNYIKDFTHSGVNITITSGTRVCDGLVIKDNYITAPITNYGRGIGHNGITGLVRNSLITGNIIYDTPTRNQIEGENIYFVGNIVDTVREGGVSLGYDYSQGLSCGARNTAEAVNVVFANNLIKNCFDEGIRLRDSAGYPVTSFTCINNITINNANSIVYHQADTLGTIDIQKNVFSEDSIEWALTQYTLDAAEAAISGMQDNLSVDPNLDSDGKPDTTNTALYHAGKVLGFAAKDFKGHKFNITPTIGAYEFTSGSVARDDGSN